MSTPGRQDDDLDALVELLDEACRLVEPYAPRGLVADPGGDGDPTSLLDQCLALCNGNIRPREPVRTLHHFACAGGTLVGKCLSAMPNVQLLSEVDPLSPMMHAPGKATFAPTDLIRLLNQSTRGIGQDTIVEVFRAWLKLVLADCDRRGLRLVLRDHAHSHFCIGATIPDRPTLRELALDVGPVLSAVTVRHPMDSYLSLLNNDWQRHQPEGFDEYCRRYLAFMERHDDVPMFRYEDFVAAPDDVMQQLCAALDVPFVGGFEDLAGAFVLTGDSGRKGETIRARPRREVPPEVAEEAAKSTNYGELARRIGYIA